MIATWGSGRYGVGFLCAVVLGSICSAEPPAAVATQPAEQEQPAVELLDEGTGPRRRLRYAHRPQPHRIDVRRSVEVTQQFEGQDPITTSVGALRLVLELRLESISESDRFRMTLQVTEAGLLDDPPTPPLFREIVKKYVPYYKAFHCDMVLDEVGSRLESSCVLPENVTELESGPYEQLHEFLIAFPARFPRQEVGVGAKWRLAEEVIDYAMGESVRVRQQVEYEVTALADDRVTLAVRIESAGDDQILKDTSLPPGATATLAEIKVTGQGTLVVDASGHLISGTIVRSAGYVMRVSIAGREIVAKGTAVSTTRVSPAGEELPPPDAQTQPR